STFHVGSGDRRYHILHSCGFLCLGCLGIIQENTESRIDSCGYLATRWCFDCVVPFERSMERMGFGWHSHRRHPRRSGVPNWFLFIETIDSRFSLKYSFCTKLLLEREAAEFLRTGYLHQGAGVCPPVCLGALW